MKKFAFALVILSPIVTITVSTSAKSETVNYKSGTETVSGYLAAPATPGRHPGHIVIHEWWGQSDWDRGEADKFSEQGYVALGVQDDQENS